VSGAASLVDWPRHTVPIHCQGALRLAREFFVAPPSRRRTIRQRGGWRYKQARG